MNKFIGTLSEAKSQGFFIIDIRRHEECIDKPNEYADEEIEMTVLLASPEDFLPPDQSVLLVCAAGARAEKAAIYLQGLGHEKVFYYPTSW